MNDYSAGVWYRYAIGPLAIDKLRNLGFDVFSDDFSYLRWTNEEFDVENFLADVEKLVTKYKKAYNIPNESIIKILTKYGFVTMEEYMRYYRYTSIVLEGYRAERYYTMPPIIVDKIQNGYGVRGTYLPYTGGGYLYAGTMLMIGRPERRKPIDAYSEPGLYDEFNQMLYTFDELIDEKFIGYSETYESMGFFESFTELSGKLVIPGYVKSIERYDAVSEKIFSGITEVIIGFGVESISDKAFKNFTSIEKLIVPNSVKYIGNEAFANCEKLKIIVLPENPTFEQTSHNVFDGCEQLSNIINLGTYIAYSPYEESEDKLAWFSGKCKLTEGYFGK